MNETYQRRKRAYEAVYNYVHSLITNGHDVPEILEAILKVFPLDIYVERAVALMAVVPGDDTKPTIWEEYHKIIGASGEQFDDFEFVERFAFYDRAKEAYAVVATSESALYANIILKKGIIKPE